MKPIFRALLATSSLFCLQCGDADVVATADFAGPSSMAVAGADWDRVLVVNSGADALQVMRLKPQLRDIDLVPGVARFHPLKLAVGERPSALASVHDGRYVFVLDGATPLLRVIDAATLTVVQRAGADLAAAVGVDGAQPHALVASRVPCASAAGGACLGRAYVALAGSGAVASFDLVDDGDGLALLAGATLPVGGAPHALAAHPRRDALFVADAAAPEVIRVEMDATGAAAHVQRTAVGGAPGPLTVSQDGTLLVVGRPRTRDVVVLAGAGSAAADARLSPLDADPTWTPRPSCLHACGDAGSACSGAHAADRALCVHPRGLATAAAGAYGAVFVGAIPARLTPVATPEHPVTLTDASGEKTVYREAVAVAGLEGSVFTIGLRLAGAGAGAGPDAAGAAAPAAAGAVTPTWLMHGADAADRDAVGAVTPTLLAHGAHDLPTLALARPAPGGSGMAAELDPTALLAPCPDGPGRARLACVEGLVQLVRGQIGQESWTLQWEAPVLDRSDGGGQIDALGRLSDRQDALAGADIRPATALGNGAAVDADMPTDGVDPASRAGGLAAAAGAAARALGAGAGPALGAGAPAADPASRAGGVAAGDILELRGPAATDPRCVDVAGCGRERRIIAVDVVAGVTTLTLDRPLAAACAPAGGQLRYRIRAGNTFVLRGGAVGAPVATLRLAPGEAYGLGQALGADAAVAFRLRALAQADDAACRYDADSGALLAGVAQDPLLSRAGSLTLTVADPFLPLRRGLAYDSQGRPAGTLGALPGGMVLSPATATLAPRLLVSYAGSNTVLVADPTKAEAIANNDIDNRVLGGRAGAR